MTQITDRIELLEEELRREAKVYLMDQFALQLLQQLDGEEEELDEPTLESLLVARPYATHETAERITELLEANDRDEEWEPAYPEPVSSEFGSTTNGAGLPGKNGASGAGRMLAEEEAELANEEEMFAEEKEEAGDELFDENDAEEQRKRAKAAELKASSLRRKRKSIWTF